MVHIKSAAIITLLCLLLFSGPSRAKVRQNSGSITVYEGENTNVDVKPPVSPIPMSAAGETKRYFKRTRKELPSFGRRADREGRRFKRRIRLKPFWKVFGK
ncbi:hypothetical protein COOONC_22605 [Cooperia oncophora]